MQNAGRRPTRGGKGSGSERAERSRAATRRCARQTAVLGALLLALIALATPAHADFPYVGDGTLSGPSSWMLAPGHTPSNIGGLAWKFGATPARPPSLESEPVGHTTVMQNNSQQDELCGVTGMSLVDSH